MELLADPPINLANDPQDRSSWQAECFASSTP